MNYESLEKHFSAVHYPCPQKECQARKFVVFNSTLDLQAHMVDEHGADMSARDRKDARRIQAEFTFDDGPGSRSGGGRRGGGGGGPSQTAQPSASGSSGPPAGSGDRRRAAFGGSLTGSQQPQPPARSTPVASRSSTPPSDNAVDPAIVECAIFCSLFCLVLIKSS